ncbi:hypothetical protein [Stappia sp.]|uniref:hypothetical protein n=1 Tax=Stappia sp. TaxID=1870903 RepID=UPI0032D8BFC3
MDRRLARVLSVGLIGGLCAVMATTGALAARPDTRTMTCAQAQDLVQRSGAIVLSTGQYTYSRFVADRRYCAHYEILRPNYAPTRDTAQCPVAYRCERVVRPRP